MQRMKVRINILWPVQPSNIIQVDVVFARKPKVGNGMMETIFRGQTFHMRGADETHIFKNPSQSLRKIGDIRKLSLNNISKEELLYRIVMAPTRPSTTSLISCGMEEL